MSMHLYASVVSVEDRVHVGLEHETGYGLLSHSGLAVYPCIHDDALVDTD